MDRLSIVRDLPRSVNSTSFFLKSKVCRVIGSKCLPTMASTSHRETEDKEEDFIEGDARITLSLSHLDSDNILDTDDIDTDGLDNLNNYAAQKFYTLLRSPGGPAGSH